VLQRSPALQTPRGAAGSSALSLSVSDDDGVTFTKARFPTDLKQQRYDDRALDGKANMRNHS
jgi:hypothetical protein